MMMVSKGLIENLQNLAKRVNEIEEFQKLNFPNNKKLYQCNNKSKENFVNSLLEFYGFIRADLKWCDLYSFQLKKGIDYDFLDKNSSQEIIDFIEFKN